MNKRQWDTMLYGIAEDQAGYFTAAQARSAGLHQVRLIQLAQQGNIERVSRGVYRFARFPVSRHGQLMEAVLWPQVRRPDVTGVVSHESALAIHELSDVSPARVHITLPAAVRIRRQVPKGLVIHYADLAPEDVSVQLVHGRASGEDEIVDAAALELTLAESYDAGRHRFDGDLVLDHSGGFGYTVRVVPRHELLASVAELGVVALP